MFPKVNRIDEKRDIKAAVMARVENVRLDMNENITDFARRMGVEYKDYKGWVERGSIDLAFVVKLSESLNLSLDYLCCRTDHPHPPAGVTPAPDYWAATAGAETGKVNRDRENQA